MGEDDVRKALLQNLVQLGSENYKENARILGILDDKAQKTGALAGAFLAAGFAFVKPENFQTASVFASLPNLTLLAVSIGLLLACTILALAAMWIRSVPKPFSYGLLEKMTLDLLKNCPNGISSSVHESFLHDQGGVWRRLLQEQELINSKKANLLRVAQVTLAAAIVIGAILLL